MTARAAKDYGWDQTVARCCICGEQLGYIGGLGIHPVDPNDRNRLICMTNQGSTK